METGWSIDVVVIGARSPLPWLIPTSLRAITQFQGKISALFFSPRLNPGFHPTKYENQLTTCKTKINRLLTSINTWLNSISRLNCYFTTRKNRFFLLHHFLHATSFFFFKLFFCCRLSNQNLVLILTRTVIIIIKKKTNQDHFQQTIRAAVSGSSRHAAVQVDRRVAGIAETITLRGQLPAGRRDDAGCSDAALARRSVRTGHHSVGSPAQNHEQHPGHAGPTLHQHVWRLPRLIESENQTNRTTIQ